MRGVIDGWPTIIPTNALSIYRTKGHFASSKTIVYHQFVALARGSNPFIRIGMAVTYSLDHIFLKDARVDLNNGYCLMN